MENIVVGSDKCNIPDVVEHIWTLTTHGVLILKWVRVVRSLRVAEEDIVRLQRDERLDIRDHGDIICTMLYIWKAKFGKSATLSALYKALVQSDLTDIAESLESRFTESEGSKADSNVFAVKTVDSDAHSIDMEIDADNQVLASVAMRVENVSTAPSANGRCFLKRPSETATTHAGGEAPKGSDTSFLLTGSRQADSDVNQNTHTHISPTKLHLHQKSAVSAKNTLFSASGNEPIKAKLEKFLVRVNNVKCRSIATHMNHEWVQVALKQILKITPELRNVASPYINMEVVHTSEDFYEQIRSHKIQPDVVLSLLFHSKQCLSGTMQLFDSDISSPETKFTNPPKDVLDFLTDNGNMLIIETKNSSLCEERLLATVCGLRKYDTRTFLDRRKPCVMQEPVVSVPYLHEIRPFCKKLIIVARIVPAAVYLKFRVTTDELDLQDLSPRFLRTLYSKGLDGVYLSEATMEVCLKLLCNEDLFDTVTLESLSVANLENSIKTKTKNMSVTDWTCLQQLAVLELLSQKVPTNHSSIGALSLYATQEYVANIQNNVKFRNKVLASYFAATAFLTQRRETQTTLLKTEQYDWRCIVNNGFEYLKCFSFQNLLFALFLNQQIVTNRFAYDNIDQNANPAFVEACCHAKTCRILLAYTSSLGISLEGSPVLHLLSNRSSCLSKYNIHAMQVVIRRILARPNKDLLEFQLTSEKFTPLFSPQIHVELIKQFIELGADLNSVTRWGNNFLHQCTYICPLPPEQFKELVVYLVYKGLSWLCNVRNKTGYTPLLGMLEHRDVEPKMLGLLKASDADFTVADNDGDTALLNAALGGRSVEVLEWIVRQSASWHERNKKGRGILHYSAIGGNLIVIERMKPAINSEDRDGRTPLILAVMEGRRNIFHTVAKLLTFGANVTARCSQGKSVLRYAEQNNDVEQKTVKLLLEHGAQN